MQKVVLAFSLNSLSRTNDTFSILEIIENLDHLALNFDANLCHSEPYKSFPFLASARISTRSLTEVWSTMTTAWPRQSSTSQPWTPTMAALKSSNRSTPSSSSCPKPDICVRFLYWPTARWATRRPSWNSSRGTARREEFLRWVSGQALQDILLKGLQGQLHSFCFTTAFRMLNQMWWLFS